MASIVPNPTKVKIKLLCASCAKVLEVHLSASGPHLKAECTQCGRFVKFISHKEVDRLQKVESFKDHREDDSIRMINPRPSQAAKKRPKYQSILPPYKGK